MIKTMSRVDEARQKALEALQNAYGRTQATPDGMMCRMGRIDRAYQLKANANGNAHKYEAAIKVLRDDATASFANADKLMATYQRLCKSQNITATIDAPTCDCSYCKGEITGSMNHEDWERFTFEVGAAVVAH
jgi:hypothetical protein